MGFGSYDEGEQEQQPDDDEVKGESVKKHARDAKHDGEDAIEDENTDEMMEHL